DVAARLSAIGQDEEIALLIRADELCVVDLAMKTYVRRDSGRADLRLERAALGAVADDGVEQRRKAIAQHRDRLDHSVVSLAPLQAPDGEHHPTGATNETR